MSIGGRFAWDDQGETPNTMFSFAEYPNGQMVFFNVRNVNYKGYQNQVFNEYYLEDGSVITGEGNYQIRRPGAKQAEKLKLSPGHVTPGGNWNSFISAVRAADPNMANGNVMDAHYGCVLGHLMNNSYRLGEPTPFNADAGTLLGNADAEDHFGRLHAIMRDGVGISDGSTQYQLGKHLTFDPTTERFTGDFADAANSLIKDDDRPGFEIPGLEAV